MTKYQPRNLPVRACRSTSVDLASTLSLVRLGPAPHITGRSASLLTFGLAGQRDIGLQQPFINVLFPAAERRIFASEDRLRRYRAPVLVVEMGKVESRLRVVIREPE